MAQKELTDAIIKNSLSPKWDTARLEWKLIDISRSKDDETCVCGHYPIREICTIQNRNNKNSLDVGNCCVKKFLGLNSEKLFASYRKVVKTPQSSFNPAVIEMVFRKKIINNWEYKFYLDTWRKRNLSDNQLFYRKKINNDIISAIRSQKINTSLG